MPRRAVSTKRAKRGQSKRPAPSKPAESEATTRAKSSTASAKAEIDARIAAIDAKAGRSRAATVHATAASRAASRSPPHAIIAHPELAGAKDDRPRSAGASGPRALDDLEDELVRRIKSEMLRKGFTEDEAARAVFESIDESGSGALSRGELTTALRRLGFERGLRAAEWDVLLQRFDAEGSGRVSYGAFARRLGLGSASMTVTGRGVGSPTRRLLEAVDAADEAAGDGVGSRPRPGARKLPPSYKPRGGASAMMSSFHDVARRVRAASGASGVSALRRVFRGVDVNGSGLLTASELESAVRSMGFEPGPGDMMVLLRRLDRDGDSAVSWREFADAVFASGEDDDGSDAGGGGGEEEKEGEDDGEVRDDDGESVGDGDAEAARLLLECARALGRRAQRLGHASTPLPREQGALERALAATLRGLAAADGAKSAVARGALLEALRREGLRGAGEEGGGSGPWGAMRGAVGADEDAKTLGVAKLARCLARALVAASRRGGDGGEGSAPASARASSAASVAPSEGRGGGGGSDGRSLPVAVAGAVSRAARGTAGVTMDDLEAELRRAGGAGSSCAPAARVFAVLERCGHRVSERDAGALEAFFACEGGGVDTLALAAALRRARSEAGGGPFDGLTPGQTALLHAASVNADVARLLDENERLRRAAGSVDAGFVAELERLRSDHETLHRRHAAATSALFSVTAGAAGEPLVDAADALSLDGVDEADLAGPAPRLDLMAGAGPAGLESVPGLTHDGALDSPGFVASPPRYRPRPTRSAEPAGTSADGATPRASGLDEETDDALRESASLLQRTDAAKPPQEVPQFRRHARLPPAASRLRAALASTVPAHVLARTLRGALPGGPPVPYESVAAQLRLAGAGAAFPDELVRDAALEVGALERRGQGCILLDAAVLADALVDGRWTAGGGARGGAGGSGRDGSVERAEVAAALQRCRNALTALVRSRSRERATLHERMLDIRPAFAFLCARSGRACVAPGDLHAQLYRLGTLRHDPAGTPPAAYGLDDERCGDVEEGAERAAVERAAVELLFREMFGRGALQRAEAGAKGADGVTEEDWALRRRPAVNFAQFARWAAPLSPALQEVREQLKQGLRAAARRGGGLFDPELVFARLDADGSGKVDLLELKRTMGPTVLAGLTPAQLGELIQSFDADGDGEIELRELVALLFEAKPSG